MPDVELPARPVERVPGPGSAASVGRGVSRVLAAAAGAPARAAATYFAMLAAVFLVYLPVAVVPYAFLDDYAELSGANGYGRSPWQSWADEGRLLSGAAAQAAFSAARGIEDLRFIRLVALCGIAALVVLLRIAFIRAQVGRLTAAAAALFVVTLPPFQVYAAWTTLFLAPFGAVLAGAASFLVSGALATRRRAVIARLAGASLLLIAAQLVYQPTAMFFWVFAAIAVLRPGQPFGLMLRLSRAHLLAGAASLAGAFAIFKLSLHYYPRNYSPRTSLTHDPLGKAHWFVREPLVRSLNLSFLTPQRAVAIAVATIIVVGILLLHRRLRARSLALLAIVAAMVPLSYLPNLVVRESWASSRSQAALAGLLGACALFGVLGVARAALTVLRERIGAGPARWASRVGTVAVLAVVVTALLLAARNVTTLFVKPQSAELTLLRVKLSAELTPGVTSLTLVRANWYDAVAPRVYCDEFGLPSSAAYWTLGPAVYDLLRERARLPQQYEVHVLPSPTGPPHEYPYRHDEARGSPKRLVAYVVPPTASASSSPGRAGVIDMRQLRTLSHSWSFWTFRMQPLKRQASPSPARGGVPCGG